MHAAVTWVLAFGGAVLSAVAAFVFFKRDLNANVFLGVIEKLTAQGEFSKARRLCGAAPDAPVARVVAHALGLRLEATVLEEEGTEADYRSAPQLVPFEDRVRAALEPAARAQSNTALKLAVLAAAGGATSMASLWPPWPSFPTVVGVAGVLLSLLSLKMHASIRRGLEMALELLPRLVRPGDQMHDAEPERGAAGDGALVLSVAGPDGSVRTVRFAEEIIKIGRLRTAQLVLDHPDVSRMHAVIEVNESEAVLIDLGASPRTRINGRTISKARLSPGAVVTIGPFELTVQSAP